MVATAVLLTTLGVIQPVQVAPAGGWFAERLVPFTQLDSTTWGATVVVTLVLIVLALLLLRRVTGHVDLRDALVHHGDVGAGQLVDHGEHAGLVARDHRAAGVVIARRVTPPGPGAPPRVAPRTRT